MEDVARDYLNELIGRNMVQVKEMRYDGKVKVCQMHDLLRDLSIRKAKEEIDFDVQNSSHQSLAKPRHRSMYLNEEISFVFSTNRNQHIRSLFVYDYHKYWHVLSGIPSSYWKSFELLRVLDMEITLNVLPKEIGELTRLRYLKMGYLGKPSRLPRSWTKLKNLEVLDLLVGFGIIIDKVILKMESMRHLYAHVRSCKVGLANMRNLETLYMFRVESCHDAWKIQGMSRVSKLGISMDDNIRETSSLFTCLSSLENLFHLTLRLSSRSTDLEGLTSLHRLTRLKLGGPDVSIGNVKLSAYFHPNLSHLTLSNIWSEEDPMPILEKLPNLIYLRLSRMNAKKGIMVITSGGFPTLKVLLIQSMTYSCKMEINEESAMPELNQFIITNCTDLDVENVPERIKSMIV